MNSDEVSKHHECSVSAWLHRLGKYSTPGIEKLASQYRNGAKCRCVEVKNGSFNWCFKVVFENGGPTWAVRFPVAGNVMHAESKVQREYAVMKFVREKTDIPVPEVIAFGAASDNHDPAMGPFIITEWVEGVPLSSLMEQLPRPARGPVLRPDLSDETLFAIYRQVANIMLELSRHNFDKIGALSLVYNDDGTPSWPVTSRPMTLKMNEIERGGYVTVDNHVREPFRTVTEYVHNLVQQNITHLFEQRNSVDDIYDARRKYILRQRVKNLIPYFVAPEYDSGPFKLLCDDFHPGNILVNDNMEVVAVIDWEWTYAGPYQFVYSPPPWLILENPTSWTDRSEALYKAKFPLFLRALEEEEVRRGTRLPPEHRMSGLMRRSVEDGKFWFNELIRESFNFDEDVLWPNIELLLQKSGLADVGIPSDQEVEDFVKRKMQDLETYNRDLQVLRRKELESEEGITETWQENVATETSGDGGLRR